jgi:hypothetical protein
LEITVSLRILIYKLEKLAMADLRRGGLLNGLRVADGVSREARGEREREREREREHLRLCSCSSAPINLQNWSDKESITLQRGAGCCHFTCETPPLHFTHPC